jgi:hypothetical protein
LNTPTRANEINFEDFQDEFLNHEMLLQQHHTPVPDQSTFAFTTHNLIPSQFSKGRPYMPSRFSSRNFSTRQGNNFTSPRPFGRGPPLYNRGFNQHQRGNFSFPNQQYNKGTSQTNPYPTRQSNPGNNYQPRQYSPYSSSSHQEQPFSQGFKAPYKSVAEPTIVPWIVFIEWIMPFKAKIPLHNWLPWLHIPIQI